MKNAKLIALLFLSFISIQALGQEVKIDNLKNATIKSFLKGIDGTDETAEKLLTTYGNNEVLENGMIVTGTLTRILFEEENCVQFETLWEFDGDEPEIMIYDLCEENGKISYFDLNFDHMEMEEEIEYEEEYEEEE